MKNKIYSELKNNSTQPEPVQEPKHLFREVEKRYNIKVYNDILICVDGNSYDDINRRYTNRETIDNVVNSYNVGTIPLLKYDDIYDLTLSGFNSMKHEINDGITDRNDKILLIPFITISRGSKRISFRIDDQRFRYLFYDTEYIMNGYEDCPNKTTEEIEEELQKYYKDQVNMLNEFFD